MDRILWDGVPQDVKDALQHRDETEAPQEGAVAIIDGAERRWYFTKVRGQWNNVGTGELPSEELAPDLDEEQERDARSELDDLLERCTKAAGPPSAAAEPQNAGPRPATSGSWGGGTLPVLKLVYGDGNPGDYSVSHQIGAQTLDTLGGARRIVRTGVDFVELDFSDDWCMHATRDQQDVLQRIYDKQCEFVLEEHHSSGVTHVARSRCHPTEFRRMPPGHLGPVMRITARVLDQEVLT